MILHPPFIISARLLPGLKIGDSFLSLDGETFYLDTPQFEYVVEDFHGPKIRTQGLDWIQSCFAAILSFMDAAAESRRYREFHLRKDEIDQYSNETLFPPHVVDWIMDNHEDIQCLEFALEEGPQLIQEEA